MEHATGMSYRKNIYLTTLIRRTLYTGCGNITSFFILHSNQAVEVVARWVWFHSRGEVLKFLSFCSVRRILRDDLHFYPYKRERGLSQLWVYPSRLEKGQDGVYSQNGMTEP